MCENYKDETWYANKRGRARNLYEGVLCKVFAKPGVLRKQINRIRLRLHPDKNGHQRPALRVTLDVMMKAVNNIAEILLDEEQREKYDRMLKSGRLRMRHGDAHTNFEELKNQIVIESMFSGFRKC